jgi:hypothetical protein
MGNELIDLLDQFAHIAEGAAADGALGNQGEPALDLIEPTGIGRSEVQVIAEMTGQPGFDLGMFVGSVILQNQVDVEVGGTLWSRCWRKARNSGPEFDGRTEREFVLCVELPPWCMRELPRFSGWSKPIPSQLPNGLSDSLSPR